MFLNPGDAIVLPSTDGYFLLQNGVLGEPGLLRHRGTPGAGTIPGWVHRLARSSRRAFDGRRMRALRFDDLRGRL